MKKLILLLGMIMAIDSFGQSVYMHEAQDEAERAGEGPVDCVIGLIVIFGAIYIIHKIWPQKSDKQSNPNTELFDVYNEGPNWEEKEREEQENELKLYKLDEEQEIVEQNNLDFSPIIGSEIQNKEIENNNKIPDATETKSTILKSATSKTRRKYSPDDLTIETMARPIDLGLSVFWADCNVGASCPEDFGRYIEWGATLPCEKWVYKKQINPLSIANLEKLKLFTGNEDGNISGSLDYDVAAKNMGDGWRMPRKEEFEELLAKCCWERAECQGVKGIKLTGPNGNQIFIPCAGVWIVDNSAFVGEVISLWSATPFVGSVTFSRYNVTKSLFSYYLQMNNKSNHGEGPEIITVCRDLAIPIRAVKDK